MVRTGDTVRRPAHDRSSYVHAVLLHLADMQFDGAPRALGFDEHGREIVSYIEGRVIRQAAELSESMIRSAAELIRRFHAATAGTTFVDGDDVVLHGDLGPHNTVYVGDRAVGLIDWDGGVRAGPRIRDVGHAVWCFADIGAGGGPLPVQARRAALFCAAYGWDEPDQVIDEITDRFRRARRDHLAAGREPAAAIFTEYIAWMERFAPALKALL